jgi:hypothetical protein
MQHITVEQLHRALITALTPQEKRLRDIEALGPLTTLSPLTGRINRWREREC